MAIPENYSERVYAGVLGKLIGVYLGRPFEGWTYQRIMQELGPINYYVHEQLNQPLVVTDDDVAGTFTFIRALEDYGISPDLSAEHIGEAWLNYIVEQRAILWWGGNGNSTEHTAWLNLKNGIPAPLSGAIATNGTAVAEQIGAQIFIDGWALVAPGQPALAAKLAREAGSVSHDGESVYAAMLWAAMEAEAFVSRDINHLLDTGLATIPADCQIARLIADIRRWHAENPQWETTRQQIEDHYGYDKYPGNCHVMPNHALMIMTLLYAPDDFHLAMTIVNTSGWDTDCNAGNVGCLLGIMLGLEGIDGGPDWRGPLADRMLISSADGGFSINDAVRISDYLVNLGRQLAGQPPAPAAKEGAYFHFSQPGSRQGFQPLAGHDHAPLTLDNVEYNGTRMLSLAYNALGRGQRASVTTPTFTPREVLNMRTYELMATPLLYPGQWVEARLYADTENKGSVTAALCCRVYDAQDRLTPYYGEPVTLAPGESQILRWRLPDCGGQPIGEIGLTLEAEGRQATGRVLLDYLSREGAPELRLSRPGPECDFWRRAWVNGVSFFSRHFPASFRISQERDEGIIIHGTRQWTDYQVTSDVVLHLGNYGGVAARVQGLRRYYAARVTREGKAQLIRVRDGQTQILAESPLAFTYEKPYRVTLRVSGNQISARIDDITLDATDDSELALHDGGIGLLIHQGALSADAVEVTAL